MNAIGVKPALPGVSSSKKLRFFSFDGSEQAIDLKPRGVCLIDAAMEETQTLKLDVNGKVDKLANRQAAGKTTVACACSQMLYQRGKLSCILHGDNVRYGLNRDLGFKAEDHVENTRRVHQESW